MWVDCKGVVLLGELSRTGLSEDVMLMLHIGYASEQTLWNGAPEPAGIRDQFSVGSRFRKAAERKLIDDLLGLFGGRIRNARGSSTARILSASRRNIPYWFKLRLPNTYMCNKVDYTGNNDNASPETKQT